MLTSINTGNGPYVFRIHGVVSHRIGSLVALEGKPPRFAQMYVYDIANELTHHMNVFGSSGDTRDAADPDIVSSLLQMLNEHNVLVKTFRVASQRLQSPSCSDLATRIAGSDSADPNVYSPPMAPELAALIVGDFSGDKSKFDIVVQLQEGPLKQIFSLHPAIMSLQYPLLFPYGEKGFYKGIKFVPVGDEPLVGRDVVSMLEYYCYRCHYRQGQPNPYICYGRLSDQAKVDAYSCIEFNRLSYISRNQNKLRGESYQGLSDAVGQGAATGRNVGFRILLPSSFIGSRRYLAQNYQDAMAICRVYGDPDLFVTFTCNPKWDEVALALSLEPGQVHSDRADICARVFKIKLNELYVDIRGGDAFGPTRAGKVYVCLFVVRVSWVVSFLLILFP
ncbi:uncharacterized protein LOC112268492 [Brachypodium distachyon]|uniref:uncharacterized protein LOC112268492 n=1 Tax=Brachypodium distachyon TaxID=15368 RepID=UPI0005300960|nr:uncharacterized protein LOC112268492 [Brachypodium distachyon]XP_024311772.1 uncharacterized protein LOC112268492 [Brachypodium distachyon]XP_024311773.1 uncharacterized protein LOC112268492 [Brachypodium distachyon]|eukprot:XP_014751337.1 uncharacterized protein LOC112268492 [Brachypodium distachyon]